MTVAGFISTQTVGVVEGRQFPTATECNRVESMSTKSAFCVCSLIAFCALIVSVMVSGSGPSSRIDPARTYGILLVMHYIPNADLAFLSVEHIMRDVNNG